MINIQLEKNSNESSLNLLRRFQKRVQGSGILPKVRSHRYAERKQSDYNKKKHTLANLKRRAETQRLIKLGKIVERTHGSR